MGGFHPDMEGVMLASFSKGHEKLFGKRKGMLGYYLFINGFPSGILRALGPFSVSWPSRSCGLEIGSKDVLILGLCNA